MNFFETFPECSLPSTVSKNIHDRSPFLFKRFDGPILPHYFVPVLVLITPVIHRSKLYFAEARNIVCKSNTREKTLREESVEYIEQ